MLSAKISFLWDYIVACAYIAKPHLKCGACGRMIKPLKNVKLSDA